MAFSVSKSSSGTRTLTLSWPRGPLLLFFFAELKDACTAEANWALQEAETLAVEHEGLVVVGIFPTGGHWEGTADAVLRLQSSWVGGRISYCTDCSRHFFGCERTSFLLIRVRKPKGKGKGDGQAKGKGKNKGKAGKKGKGAPAPKRAAAPGGGLMEELVFPPHFPLARTALR